MKEYKDVVRGVQKSDGRVNPLYSGYFRYAHRELPMLYYTAPKNRDPYYDRDRRRRGNSDYGNNASLGNGYPELKPVGSRI